MSDWANYRYYDDNDLISNVKEAFCIFNPDGSPYWYHAVDALYEDQEMEVVSQGSVLTVTIIL